MATTYTITDVTRNPSGVGRTQEVVIKLVDNEFRQIYGYYDAGVIVDEIAFSSDSSGTLAVDLVANADISPINSYYSIKIGLQPPVLIDVVSDGSINDLLV